jgi:hypothetical protein
MSEISKGLGLLVWLTLLSLGTSSYATSFTVALDPGTTQITTALAAADVATGQDMTGMSVTAFFTGGSLQTATWNPTGGPQAGGAFGTNWQLIQSGNTQSPLGPWTLQNSTTLSIERLLIDAGSGNAVFDTSFSGLDGTNLSGAGFSFLPLVNPGLDILATYRDTVALANNAPVGDTFRFLDVAFTNPGRFATGNTLVFIADTDLLATPGDIAPVPEPGTFVLLATALVTMLGYRWRFRKLNIRS